MVGGDFYFSIKKVQKNMKLLENRNSNLENEMFKHTNTNNDNKILW